MEEMVAVHFKAGEVIFKEGDAPGAVYLINQGSVKIVKDRGGKDDVLATLGFNNIFGEMALIDKKPRSASAIAVKDTWCYKLDAAAFQEKLGALDPLMRGICQVLVSLVRGMTTKYPAEMAQVVASVPQNVQEQAPKPVAAVPAEDDTLLVDERGRPLPPSKPLPMVDL